MTLGSFEAIARALQGAGVRYLVAGGLAVNAHGYLRFTKDVDVVIEFIPDNIERTFAALGGLGFRPAVPVTAAQFSDAGQRAAWARDKGMMVLQLWSDAHKETSVDIFVTEQFDFDAEYAKALRRDLGGGVDVRFTALDTLIEMKERAGRPEDRIDIENLRRLHELGSRR